MAEDKTPMLGFIGLGNLGAPMAARLVDWPGGLIVFDVRPARQHHSPTPECR